MIRRKDIKAYLLIAPAVTIAVLFSIYPFAKSLVDSFLTVSQSGRIIGFAGLDNYRMLFRDEAFHNSLRTTILFALLFVPLNTALTLSAASLTRNKTKLSSVAETIFFLPMSLSLAASSMIFKEMFRGRISIINRIFGTSIEWLSNSTPALFVLILLGVFLDFGLDYILLLSAFRSNDRSVVEAAMLDGAGSMRILFEIEIPMIKKMLIATVFLAAKDALLIVAPIMIVTEGGPFRATETLMYYYYLEAFKSGNRGIQNTLSVILVSCAAAFMALSGKRRKR